MDLTTRIFLLWTFIFIGRPQDSFYSLQAIRPILLLGIVTLTFVLLNSAQLNFGGLFGILEVKQYALFYCVMIVGIPFAYHQRVAFESALLGYGINVIYFILCTVIMDSV